MARKTQKGNKKKNTRKEKKRRTHGKFPVLEYLDTLKQKPDYRPVFYLMLQFKYCDDVVKLYKDEITKIENTKELKKEELKNIYSEEIENINNFKKQIYDEITKSKYYNQIADQIVTYYLTVESRNALFVQGQRAPNNNNSLNKEFSIFFSNPKLVKEEKEYESTDSFVYNILFHLNLHILKDGKLMTINQLLFSEYDESLTFYYGTISK